MPVTRSATRAQRQRTVESASSQQSGVSSVSLTNSNDENDQEMDDYEEDYDYEYEYSEDEDAGGEYMENASMEDVEDSASDEEDASNVVGNPNAPRDRSSSFGIGSGDKFKGGSNGIQILDSADLLPVMYNNLKEVTDVLQIPTSAAFILLRNQRWNKERLFELFYTGDDDEKKKLLESCGVLERVSRTSSSLINVKKCPTGTVSTCQICFEDDIDVKDMYSMPCGHSFCRDCWVEYIEHMILSGPSDAIHTKCPQAGCQEIVTEDEMRDVLCGGSCSKNHSLIDKFRGYQLRCFVEQNGHTRWCPAAGCDKVAYTKTMCSSGDFSSGPVATCTCTHKFCLKCGEEPHAPAYCSVLTKWKDKCRNESETANWILANTKACPRCSSRIEKNQGCNHMTCQSCKYEFCWICMGDWNDHGTNTGGFYKCNRFNASNDSNITDADRAKRELDRYLHYYKRYHAHAEAQKFATKQLADTEAKMVLLQEASDTNTTWIDVQFLKTATEQLVECRRVLKYTYVYAYFMHAPSDSNISTIGTKASIIGSQEVTKMQMECFENHQEMLERFTENLSELSEKPMAEMNRKDVINQTRVVDRFMKNVLKYVEDGMDG
mmetsp:Transcript_3472/g.4718  ORF Transcript_3472/g.4718 Transcript_3472/m.4718 type:complete len:606 (+) Transcript_3472:667-2484(+)|eukprot:CAMPEP_0116063190 /NCGR_PEP_ID=MMETSP0322-20121206/8265_1 /TAXON_ID=163516 /ORGANISM="Leptocylindrus danicus var. apora, Strain B651" /LENGTH=605 /DNA_ID=CAMNT_0003548757 /DNA_START=440 /DNA_END=2257 /DNA_ORIENTATION=-